MADLSVKGLKKSFGDHVVLKGVSFDVKSGDFLSLLGPSGCGKTTILRIICGLETADEGEVLVDGADVTKVRPEKRNIGLVFQNYALFPSMNVAKNVGYGLKMHKVPQPEIDERVNEALELVKLGGYNSRRVTQLSGGEQQRVALARALVTKPNILLLDEPLSALDRKVRAEMQYEIRRIQQQVGITTIFVTHDQEEAMTMSDEILLMRNGGIEQLSTPENIYNHPVSLYASDFLGKANTLIGTLHQAPDGWTVFGDGWKFPVEPQNGFADGEEVCLAIRGEQTRILDAAADGATAAEITDIVFTGEICRITARAGGATLSLACINVQAEHYRPGQTVYVLADRSKTHYFKK